MQANLLKTGVAPSHSVSSLRVENSLIHPRWIVPFNYYHCFGIVLHTTVITEARFIGSELFYGRGLLSIHWLKKSVKVKVDLDTSGCAGVQP